MPSLELLITIIAGIANILLGGYTYFNNRKSDTSKYFALFTIVVSLYLLANFLSLHQTNSLLTFFWIKVVMGLASLLNLSFFFLTATYPQAQATLKPKFVIGSLAITGIVLILAFSNTIFTRADLTPSGPSPVPGFGMAVFLLQTILLLGGGFYVLIKRFRHSETLEKAQIKMFFFGAGVMFSSILITNLVLVLLFNIGTFVNLLPIYALIFIVFISYAIVKHGLFDLRIVATQALIITIWIVLFSKLFLSRSAAEGAVDLLVFFSVVVFGILLIKSVSREIKQREELQLLNEKMKELDIRKNEFLNMAAHELRAPMTAIKGYISMLIEGDAGEIPEKARGFLTDAQGVTERLIRLVNNMLNVSRIEENRMVFQVENVHLAEVARTVFSEFRGEAVRKNLQFDLDIPSEVKDLVTVDSDRIHEVVANFLSNSIKYTEQGFVKLTLSQTDDRHIRVSVSDSGLGISPEEQKKLFQKFSRAESAVGKTVGTGLGLYITKLLVEKFGGTIGLTSESGKGSTFWFELPIVNS